MTNIREELKTYRAIRLEKLSQKTDVRYVDLTNEQENQLIKSILKMDTDRQNLLIFKNYYEHTFEEIEDVFNIENAKNEYLNLIGILAEYLELNDEMISDKSIKKVCEKAHKKINEGLEKEFDYKPKTSTQKKILIFNSFLTKRVASIVLSVIIGSSMLLGANAYAEGRIFKWITNTFEKYTSYIIASEDIIDKSNLLIDIAYIPKGYELSNKSLLDSMDIYYYSSDDKYFVINILYDTVNSGISTENTSSKTEFKFDDVSVITWQEENQNYFMCHKDKLALQIYGNITKDEFIKIYDNISIKEK